VSVSVGLEAPVEVCLLLKDLLKPGGMQSKTDNELATSLLLIDQKGTSTGASKPTGTGTDTGNFLGT